MEPSVQIPPRNEVTAVHVRLRTAIFFGYARLRTDGCEGDARLCTVDQQSTSEPFYKEWCWWKLCLRAQCIVADPPVNSGPSKNRLAPNQTKDQELQILQCLDQQTTKAAMSLQNIHSCQVLRRQELQ